MDRLDIITDLSKPLNKDQIWTTSPEGIPYKRHAYSPEEELNLENHLAVSEERQIGSLEDHTRKHWEAHLKSGHDSSVTNLMTIQYVDLYECNAAECQTIERSIHYSSSMILQVTRIPDNSSTIPLRSLIQSNLEESFAEKIIFDDAAYSEIKDRARPCKNSKHRYPNRGHGEYTKKVRRITRAPPIFTVEINRRSEVGYLSFSENMTDQEKVRLAEDTIQVQRITDYQQLDMADWSTSITEAMTPSERNGRNLDITYNIHGIVAYSHVRKHYTLFVRSGAQWVYFDDLTASPIYRNPSEDWPQNFVEHMLVFKIVDSVAQTGMALATIQEEPNKTPLKAGILATRSEQPAKDTPAVDAATMVQSRQDATKATAGSLISGAAAAGAGKPHDLDYLKTQIEQAFSASSVKESHELVSLAQTLHLDKLLRYSETAAHLKRDTENLIKQYNVMKNRQAFYESTSPLPRTATQNVQPPPAPRKTTPPQLPSSSHEVTTSSPHTPERQPQSQGQAVTQPILAPPPPQISGPPQSPGKRQSLRSFVKKASSETLSLLRPARSKNTSPQASPQKKGRKRSISKVVADNGDKQSEPDQGKPGQGKRAPKGPRYF